MDGPSLARRLRNRSTDWWYGLVQDDFDLVVLERRGHLVALRQDLA